MDELIARILDLAVNQGIWAVLYIYLFFRMLKDTKEREAQMMEQNSQREEAYQQIIERLSSSIETRIAIIQDTLNDMSSRDQQGSP